jgi:hypothetical protein
MLAEWIPHRMRPDRSGKMRRSLPSGFASGQDDTFFLPCYLRFLKVKNMSIQLER